MSVRVGATLGKYEIVGPIRSGGMASLYLAKRNGAAGFSKAVAIKVIHPHLAEDPHALEMFVEEAKIASRIDDSHVAHVEELDHEGGLYFIAMEYVLGASLAQLIVGMRDQKRQLAPEIAVRIVADAARGLHAAHEATSESGAPLGIVHRDVSPQNVLVSSKGVVKLIDFGIAKTVGAAQTDSLRGKLGYMSPEQAMGARLDCRADVYALGVVLWELLTFERRFNAEGDLQLLDMVRDPEPMPLLQRVPGLPAKLDDVLLRALAKERDARWPSALAFSEALLFAVPGAATIGVRDLAQTVAAAVPEKLARERALLGETGDAGRKSDRLIAEVVGTKTEPVVGRTMTYVGAGALVVDAPVAAAGTSRRSVATGLALLVAVALGLGIVGLRGRLGPEKRPVAEPVALAVASGAVSVPVTVAPAETSKSLPPATTPPPSKEEPAASADPSRARRPARRAPSRPEPKSSSATTVVHGTPLVKTLE